MSAILDHEEASAVSGLADIDRRILRLVAAGQTSKEIARTLERSPFTIDSRLKDVCQRLGADTRAQAAAMLLREEAMTPPPELGGTPQGGIEARARRSPDGREDGDPRKTWGIGRGALAAPSFDPRMTRMVARLLFILVAITVAAYFLANAIAAVQEVFLIALRG